MNVASMEKRPMCQGINFEFYFSKVDLDHCDPDTEVFVDAIFV